MAASCLFPYARAACQVPNTWMSAVPQAMDDQVPDIESPSHVAENEETFRSPDKESSTVDPRTDPSIVT